MNLRALFLRIAFVCSATSGALAAVTFTANLTHDQEPPPAGTTPPTTSTGSPRPLSFGTATLVLNDTNTALTLTANIFNIDVTGTQTPGDTNDNLVSAHIHAAAAPGSNAGVVWGFFGTPDNDNNPDNLVVTPFIGSVGGTFTSVWDLPEGNGTNLAAQIPNLMAGLAYLNFHTVQFGGGEIRGQILPPGAVPDTGSTALLMLAGLAAMMAVHRVRRGR